jgi:hypothetical protein
MNQRLEAAVREILADVRRFVAPGIVAARGVERLLVIKEGDELPAERRRRENTSALLEMEALGNTRDAAMKVARRRSSNPHTREMLAQRFRRLRRAEKKANEQCAFDGK